MYDQIKQCCVRSVIECIKKSQCNRHVSGSCLVGKGPTKVVSDTKTGQSVAQNRYIYAERRLTLMSGEMSRLKTNWPNHPARDVQCRDGSGTPRPKSIFLLGLLGPGLLGPVIKMLYLWHIMENKCIYSGFFAQLRVLHPLSILLL